MKHTLIVLILLTCNFATANSHQFFKKEFKDKNGCFLLVSLKDQNVQDQFNPRRCLKRLSPMSTFKIPLLVMAYDNGYFKSSNQRILWDKKQRDRDALNNDQTPKTFIAHSVIWVSRLITHFIGQNILENYLNKFNYGNKKTLGGLDNFWLSKGSLRISAKEQVQFLSDLWLQKFQLKDKTLGLTKKTIFTRSINGMKIYGKTGSGCLDTKCQKQLGWFVGILEDQGRSYAFSLNFSDLKDAKEYAGPRAKKIAYRYFKEWSHFKK